MRKVIHVNGGIGRVICAEPAIRAVHKQTGIKPDVITSWPEVFWNNPHVNKVYREQHEWIFEDVVKNGDYVQPEPYHFMPYYSQKQHLVQSFKQLVGIKPTLEKPRLFLSQEEIIWASGFVENIRTTSGKKVAAFQPFGAGFDNGIDNTHRSLSIDHALRIADNSTFMLLNCTKVQFNHKNVWQREFTTRELIAVISECDYVIGVDSSASHIGAAFNKSGKLFLGGTYPKNIGWDNYKIVIKKGFPKTYFANRFHGFLNDNSGAMNFSEKELLK